MATSAYLHSYADKNIPHKQQAIIKAFAKALEVIPRQLCDNAGFDATDILNRLRVEHVAKGNTWAGVDFDNEGVANNLDRFVWEPSLVKVNAIQAATEAACLILSVDETISTSSLARRPSTSILLLSSFPQDFPRTYIRNLRSPPPVPFCPSSSSSCSSPNRYTLSSRPHPPHPTLPRN